MRFTIGQIVRFKNGRTGEVVALLDSQIVTRTLTPFGSNAFFMIHSNLGYPIATGRPMDRDDFNMWRIVEEPNSKVKIEGRINVLQNRSQPSKFMFHDSQQPYDDREWSMVHEFDATVELPK